MNTYTVMLVGNFSDTDQWTKDPTTEWLQFPNVEIAIEQAFVHQIAWVVLGSDITEMDRQKLERISTALDWDITFIKATAQWRPKLQAAIAARKAEEKPSYRFYEGLFDADQLNIQFN